MFRIFTVLAAYLFTSVAALAQSGCNYRDASQRPRDQGEKDVS